MNRGDVVVVDWPYSDRAGSKIRPAVVIQADYLNGLLDDTILVQLTTVPHGIPGTEVRLDPALEAASGLLSVSYAFCVNLLTIDQLLIVRTIGSLSQAATSEIEASLKATLALP